MYNEFSRKLNLLSAYAFVSTIFLFFMVFSSFRESERKLAVDELTLKKLNLIGEDGGLRLVLSNESRQHPGRIDGKDLPKRERPAGILFFNSDGDECGGITASVFKQGKLVNSGMSFTMDNYRNDQVLQLINDEVYENDKVAITRGLVVNEYPIGASLSSLMQKVDSLGKVKDPKQLAEKQKELMRTEGVKPRLFLGRNGENDNGLFLFDSSGNPKLKIYLDKTGNPKIEIVGKDGKLKSMLVE